RHWSTINDAPYLWRLIFFDEHHGYGIDGKHFLRTEDGGHSWSETAIPGLEHVATMYFLNPRLGWVTAGSLNRYSVFRTIDGGQHWTESPGARPNQSFGVGDLFFLDQNRGW